VHDHKLCILIKWAEPENALTDAQVTRIPVKGSNHIKYTILARNPDYILDQTDI